jgi:hypothetical protein
MRRGRRAPANQSLRKRPSVLPPPYVIELIIFDQIFALCETFLAGLDRAFYHRFLNTDHKTSGSQHVVHIDQPSSSTVQGSRTVVNASTKDPYFSGALWLQNGGGWGLSGPHSTNSGGLKADGE